MKLKNIYYRVSLTLKEKRRAAKHKLKSSTQNHLLHSAMYLLLGGLRPEERNQYSGSLSYTIIIIVTVNHYTELHVPIFSGLYSALLYAAKVFRNLEYTFSTENFNPVTIRILNKCYSFHST